MINNITNLYPQYQYSQDRRQNNIPVAIERRSGNDRRSQNRVTMDSKLTRDLYEVKERVAKLENFSLSILFPLDTTPTPFSPPAEPLATTFFPPSVSMILITLHAVYKWNHTGFILLCLAYFT